LYTCQDSRDFPVANARDDIRNDLRGSGTIDIDRDNLYPCSKSTVMLQDKIEQSIVRKGFSRLSLASTLVSTVAVSRLNHFDIATTKTPPYAPTRGDATDMRNASVLFIS
jgi:hypothetical protein